MNGLWKPQRPSAMRTAMINFQFPPHKVEKLATTSTSALTVNCYCPEGPRIFGPLSIFLSHFFPAHKTLFVHLVKEMFDSIFALGPRFSLFYNRFDYTFLSAQQNLKAGRGSRSSNPVLLCNAYNFSEFHVFLLQGILLELITS